jgi:pimeloyl-ACP methyl ester carboxylesterase
LTVRNETLSTPHVRCIEAIKTDEVRANYLAAYDGLLRKWPAGHEELLLPTRIGLTHVVASGPAHAPPVVLLHAFQATAMVWVFNVEALSRHFRVYAIDVIGQGGKSASAGPIKSRGDFADWMSDLFDALGIVRASLVGNSYGGFLALSQASLTPERVHRVVMINPAGTFASFYPKFLQMIFARVTQGLLVAIRLRTVRPAPSIASTLGRNVAFTPEQAEWAHLVSLVAFNGQMRPNAIAPSVLSSAELRKIRAPALLLLGDNELLYDPQEVLRRAQRRMPALEARMIPGAHHIAAMAKPDEVNAQIIEFLQR